MIGAQFQEDVDVLVVLEDMLEFHNAWVAQRFVDLNLSYQLHRLITTFCLARERFRELLAMILAAEIRFDSKLVTS